MEVVDRQRQHSVLESEMMDVMLAKSIQAELLERFRESERSEVVVGDTRPERDGLCETERELDAGENLNWPVFDRALVLRERERECVCMRESVCERERREKGRKTYTAVGGVNFL